MRFALTMSSPSSCASTCARCCASAPPSRDKKRHSEGIFRTEIRRKHVRGEIRQKKKKKRWNRTSVVRGDRVGMFRDEADGHTPQKSLRGPRVTIPAPANSVGAVHRLARPLPRHPLKPRRMKSIPIDPRPSPVPIERPLDSRKGTCAGPSFELPLLRDHRREQTSLRAEAAYSGTYRNERECSGA